jgi:hypothetical protein
VCGDIHVMGLDVTENEACRWRREMLNFYTTIEAGTA